MNKPTCIVLGGSGFLGSAALPELDRIFHVIPTSAKPRGGRFHTLDIRDAVALRGFIRDANPDIVIALAANRDPDNCEENPDEARRLNTDPIAVLIETLSNEVTLLFVSTDYVFDGLNPPYKEEAVKNPISVYGKTKSDAEDLALSRANSIVLRVPLLMGWMEHVDQSGFFSQLLNDLKNPGPLALDDVLARYPVWTRDAGNAMCNLLKVGATGIWHFSTVRQLTRYKAACEMGELLGWSTEHLQPTREAIVRKARRPLNAHLDMSKWQKAGYEMPQDFKIVANQFLKHFGLI